MKTLHTIPRDQHTISRSNISDNALKVLYRLKEGGYSAFLVGGSVRDLLLGQAPKDFDIATEATPEEVRKLFRNCRLIGRRFRLAHIQFGNEIIEVATFRRQGEVVDKEQRCLSQSGMILRDNAYGTVEEDAWRRDFSVNALYYTIADFSVVDFTGGMQDLNNKILRLIGDPEQRCIEDPARILRAIRFSAKLGLSFDPHTELAMQKHRHLVRAISPSRLFEEVLKLFHSGFATESFFLLRQQQLFGELFPAVERLLQRDELLNPMLMTAFKSTDERIHLDKGVNTAFLFAVILWLPLMAAFENNSSLASASAHQFEHQINMVINEQLTHMNIPRRFLASVIEIWKLQPRFERRFGTRPWRLLEHRKFRVAYDFLLLRSSIDPELKPLVDWWTAFQESDEVTQRAMVKECQPNKKKGKE